LSYRGIARSFSNHTLSQQRPQLTEFTGGCFTNETKKQRVGISQACGLAKVSSGKSRFLLHASDAGIEANQRIENREDVAAVFHHAREDVAQAWFALSLPVPASQDVSRHFDIPAKFLGGVPTQKQAIKEGGFTLRVLKFPQSLLADNELLAHTRESAVYPNSRRRQEGPK
jgi:hypothetical protein